MHTFLNKPLCYHKIDKTPGTVHRTPALASTLLSLVNGNTATQITAKTLIRTAGRKSKRLKSNDYTGKKNTNETISHGTI
jgi:hypothetical protein